jgi:type VI protein secretion system component Hcp
MGWSQIFLNIQFRDARTIEGECEFEGYEGQIVLMDFSWGMGVKQDLPRVNDKPVRTPKFEQLSIVKRFDSASVKLLNCLQSRDIIEKATISVAHRINEGEGGLRNAFVLEIEKAFLESVSLDMDTDGNSIILKEEFSLRYSKVKVMQYPVDDDGRYTKKAKTYQSQLQDVTKLDKG